LYRIVRDYSNHFSQRGLHRFLDTAERTLTEQAAAPEILNIGSGGPLGSRVASINRGSVVTIDVDIARQPDIVADATTMECFRSESFDAVFMMEVLEHIPAPQRALSEVRRVLRPDGYLFLSAPFLFEIHDDPGDFYRYTRNGLRIMLAAFSERDISARNGYTTALLVPLFRLYRSRYFLDRLLGLVALGMSVPLYPVILLADRLIRSDLATTGYTAVCRK
jgi:SAM-dependent methyltransferase